jgi:hypothetical protein
MTFTKAQIDRAERFWEDLDERQRKALLEHPAVKARIGATCELTPRQVEADALLNSAATHGGQ